MKMTLAIERPGLLPPAQERRGEGASLSRYVIRGLEWIGRSLERRAPTALSERTVDLTYWRIHGWPF